MLTQGSLMITYMKRDEIGKMFGRKLIEQISLEKIILFGSTVRKNDKISSDIDICLIGLFQKLDPRTRDVIDEVATDILLETGLVINWIYFADKTWKHDCVPIITTIKKEGEILWEKEKIE